MSTIAVWTPHDLVLSFAIPLGLATRRRTAIVIDCDPSGPPLPGGGDLASLVERGPSESDLSPSRAGVAVLGNGGIDVSDASEVIEAIAHRWPNVVLRCSPHASPGRGAVTVIPVLPEPFAIVAQGKVAYQRTSLGGDPETDAIVLPVPRQAVIRSLMSGRMPPMKDRWMRALDAVWSLS